MDEAVALFKRWAQIKLPSFPGATLEVVRLPRRTPVIMIEVPDEGEATVLPYGISDKQPRWWGGRRARPLDPASGTRQALWARWGRRRIWDVRRVERAAGSEKSKGWRMPVA